MIKARLIVTISSIIFKIIQCKLLGEITIFTKAIDEALLSLEIEVCTGVCRSVSR